MRILLFFVFSFSAFSSGNDFYSGKSEFLPMADQLLSDTIAEKRPVIPDSANYTAYASLLSESMGLLLGEEGNQPIVSKKMAPFYLYPSPVVRQQVEKIKPFWIEALQLKAQIAASASAFDAAWEEVIAAASIESEEGTREALALAFQHKAELETLQKKMSAVAEQAKKAGEPVDPVEEYRKTSKEYHDHFNSAKKMLSKGATGVSPVVTGKGIYKLLKVENRRNYDVAKMEYKDGKVRVTEQSANFEAAEMNVPAVIIPETPVELHIKLEFRTIERPFFIESADVYLKMTYGAHSQLGIPANWTLTRLWKHFPVHSDEKMKVKILEFTEDKVSFSLPNRQKLLQDAKLNRKPVWNVRLRDQLQIRTFEGNYFNIPMIDIPFKEYNLVEMYDHRQPADMKVLAEDSKVAYLQMVGKNYSIVMSYQWVDDGTENLPADEISQQAKSYRVAEIDANLTFIRGSIKLNREQLSKETDPGKRARLEYEILNAETEALAEEDMKKSILTGQLVHTRSPFDDFARGQFIENIRTEQMRMEEFQRCSASLQRLAGLLSPADADQAREFISRQVTPDEVLKMDVTKLRQIATILQKQVEAKAAMDVARGEEEAAQVGLDWANRVKTVADAGMMATSLVAGPWLNVAYQGGTGAWDGGWAEGITRAASTYSMPSFLAVQAFQGYREGGWQQAGTNVAISFVTGKVIQYGLTKSITAAGKLMGGSSKEAFELAKYKQARERGESLVKDFQRTEGEVIRLRAAIGRGEKGAADKLRQMMVTREAKAAAIHENMHAKSFLKYKSDYHTRKVFNEDLELIHKKTQEIFHGNMQGKGWTKTPLKEFRNASSAGTSGMDYDIGLDEKLAGTLTKNGSKATLQQWQKEAQTVWNQAYKEVTGRSAIRSWETVTTSIHPEAYKDLAWLSGNPAAVNKLWTQQAVDVTRFKNWHMMNDESLTVYEKLQEVCRGSAKDMQTKLLGTLGKLASAGGTNAAALQKVNQHWRKIFGVLEKFGKGDADPLKTSRQIREMTGGKSITEVLEDMTTLMEMVGK